MEKKEKSYKVIVGSIVYATEQGLGYLAKSFYDNGIVDYVYVVPHARRENHYEWYPNRVSSVEELCKKVDVLLFFETPFYPSLYNDKSTKHIKKIMMPMYECSHPTHVKDSDGVINPSLLDQKYYPQGVFIPVPVQETWRLREKAQVFVHNAGNGGLDGRNGTKELIEAMQYVKSPIQLIIRSQAGNIECDDPRVTIVNKSLPKEELWKEGDVFIFPEQFNGLSLPIQEALASGMLVMATRRFPTDTYCPLKPLLFNRLTKKSASYISFDRAFPHPMDIARDIDTWYGKDITEYSLKGKAWAEKNSWEVLRPRYIQYIEDVYNGVL